LFVIAVLVAAQTDPADEKSYMRRCYPELDEGWRKTSHFHVVPTSGVRQKLNFANTVGLFRGRVRLCVTD